MRRKRLCLWAHFTMTNCLPLDKRSDFFLDDDTIEFLHNTHPERVRLSDIDCPERGQAYGRKAKQAASALVFEKTMTLQTHGKDTYISASPRRILTSVQGLQVGA